MRTGVWSGLVFAAAAPVALLALGACGSDEAEATPGPSGSGAPSGCVTSLEGLPRTALSKDTVGKGFALASVDGAFLLSTVDQGIFRVDVATGAQTTVLPKGQTLTVARDGLALAKPFAAAGTATVDLTWINADGTVDAKRSAVPASIDWIGVTPTVAIGQITGFENGVSSFSLHRLDRATGEIKVIPTPGLTEEEYIDFGGLARTAQAQTDRHLVGIYSSKVGGETSYALYLVPFDGSAPSMVQIPGGAKEATVIASQASRVFLRWRSKDAQEFRPRILLIDPLLPDQAVDLGILPSQPGTTKWEESTGYAIASAGKLSLAYSSVVLSSDFSMSTRFVQIMTSDLSAGSLTSVSCLQATTSERFAGHPSTGLFVLDPLNQADPAFLRLVAPP